MITYKPNLLLPFVNHLVCSPLCGMFQVAVRRKCNNAHREKGKEKRRKKILFAWVCCYTGLLLYGAARKVSALTERFNNIIVVAGHNL